MSPVEHGIVHTLGAKAHFHWCFEVAADGSLAFTTRAPTHKANPGDGMMIFEVPTERGFGKVGAAFALVCLLLAVMAVFFGRPVRQYVRESLLQSVTSAHYQVLCPPRALSQEAMTRFAMQREMLFVAVDRKLNDAASNAEIRVIFDPDFKPGEASSGAAQTYEVTGATVRTGLRGRVPQLDPAADAEALLHVAWGKSGSSAIAHWTAVWLVGQWHGQELGMAAAEVEQRVGHQTIVRLLGPPSDAAISPEDRALLGAAWVSAMAELGGAAEVRKLYSARMTKLDVAEVTKALGTTSTELERKWQMWMYAYIAGMPPAGHSMAMPMDVPMSTSH
jgi:hypothetical protein